MRVGQFFSKGLAEEEVLVACSAQMVRSWVLEELLESRSMEAALELSSDRRDRAGPRHLHHLHRLCRSIIRRLIFPFTFLAPRTLLPPLRSIFGLEEISMASISPSSM
jgi:hypothetical protein